MTVLKEKHVPSRFCRSVEVLPGTGIGKRTKIKKIRLPPEFAADFDECKASRYFIPRRRSHIEKTSHSKKHILISHKISS
jgi:hypothetical protein